MLLLYMRNCQLIALASLMPHALVLVAELLWSRIFMCWFDRELLTKHWYVCA
jgi:hypothetical protein